MKKILFFLLATFSVAMITLTSCKKDPVDETVDVSFKTEILPIFAKNCSTSGCHDTETAKKDIILEKHDQIAPKAANLIKTMRHEDGVSPMPKNADKLADNDIELFSKWIEQGKKDN